MPLALTSVGSVLFALVGLYWLHDATGRWRSDLEVMRTSKVTTEKLVLVGIWLVTLSFTLGLLNLVIRVIRTGVEAF